MENKAPKPRPGKSHSTSRMPSASTNNTKLTTTQKPVKSKSTSALPKNQHAYKKGESYKVISKSSLLKDFKNTAANGFANVKQRLNSFSALIKHSKKSKSGFDNYCQINEQPTPIKLYSPFNFESPEPSKISEEERIKLRQQLFVSPTNKIKDDVTNLGNGIEELNFIAQKFESNMQQQYHPTNPFLNQQTTSKQPSVVSTRLMFDDESSLI